MYGVFQNQPLFFLVHRSYACLCARFYFVEKDMERDKQMRAYGKRGDRAT